MATPPYANITGIYTTDDKHHSISRANYSGSAKPGQIVVDTADYSLWVGTNTGDLIAAGGGGGGGGSATPAGADTQVQFNNAGAFGGAAGFTFNSTTGVLTAPKLAGNGASLTGLAAANIVGTVATATNAATANAVAGANVTGAVAFATTANSVAIANVVGAGNIAVLNLNGDGTKVLAGNGAWVTSSGGGSGLPTATISGQIVSWNGTAWVATPSPMYWTFPTQTTDALYVADVTASGATLLVGSRYYNTTTKKLRTYDGTVWADVDSGGGTTSTQDLSLALTGPAIDVTLAGYFYYTATTNVTLSVTNVPTTANVVTSFILEIKNGSTRITWWPNITWAGGVVPTLTTTGTDSIAFYSYNDAGTVKWRGLPLAFDIR